MRGVLYVPGLETNLYSIGTATDAGMEILFSRDGVTMSRNGITLMEGKRAGQTLYHLNIQVEEMAATVTTALRSTKVEPLSIWHLRLGHANHRTILRMASLGCTDGLTLFNDKTSSTCAGCLLGKMHRLPFDSGRRRATAAGEIIHTGVCGPLQVPTPDGFRYFVTFKDDFSNWCVTRLIKNKSEVATALREFVAQVKTETGNDVKTIRSDNGGEYLGKELQAWLAQSGIRHETSAPYTPQQNGVSERLNRSIMEATRSLLYGKQVPIELWGEAVLCSTYLLNRLLPATSDSTPYELWYGRKPTVHHLRIFGCPAFAHVPDQLRRKLDQKATESVLVGYCETSKAYRLWNPATRKLIISRDVVFDENATYDKVKTGTDTYYVEAS